MIYGTGVPTRREGASRPRSPDVQRRRHVWPVVETVSAHTRHATGTLLDAAIVRAVLQRAGQDVSGYG